jgi:ABC-type polysaccharide/polyol phosphate transport system ATPase subunit
MASIRLKNVTVDFPVYGSAFSLRGAVLNRAIGGLLRRPDANNKRLVVRAIDNLSLRLGTGDRLGIVGHNGAGKSTLLKVLSKIYEPTNGLCLIDGHVSPLFAAPPGFDFEDTGHENIITCGLLLGMSRTEITNKRADIEEFAELGDFLSLPVRTYSTGMIVRLGFAIATSINPDILLLDETFGAGDERFAHRAQRRIEALIEQSNIMVLATHSRDLIRQMCNRAILMNHGRIIADGTPDEILDQYHRMTSANVGTEAASINSEMCEGASIKTADIKAAV